MIRRPSTSLIVSIFLIPLLLATVHQALAQFPRFKALAFYSTTVEPAHIVFAQDAVQFFKELTVGNGFVLDVTDTMADLNEEKLKGYSL
jgi:uncharacterized protein